MRALHRHLCVGYALTFVSVGVLLASPASADCIQAGNSTVCGQGEVRGGGPTPPTAGYYPSYCYDDWYCGDDWNLDIIIDPGPPGIGRPGGIGPRR